MKSERMPVVPPAPATDEARPPAVWVVCANGGQYTDLFVAGGYVAVGWFDLSSVRSVAEIRRIYRKSYPDAPAGQAVIETGQIAAFCFHIRQGDYVIAPSADRKSLRYGRVTGSCVNAESKDGCPHRNRRAVDWFRSALSRSDLPEALRRTLGTPRTVFRVHQPDQFLAAIGRPPGGQQEQGASVGRGDTAGSRSLRNDTATEFDPDTLPQRPLPETQTGQVWVIANEITREKGRPAERNEVIERFVARGGNRNTAGTSYYRWRHHYDALSSPNGETTPENHGPTATAVVTSPNPPAETRRDDGRDDLQPLAEEDDADYDSGVEKEQEDPQEHAEHPFDPSKIKIRTIQVLVDQLVSRIEHQEIDLAPDFQRMRGIWDDQRKSRLIESLLLRIPIPVFYVAANEEEQWSVVDGLQRMSTIHDYVTGKFALQRLEYRKELNGQRHDLLPRPMRRRIGETQLIVNVIEPGTPPEVMFNIFRRINTGGMTLNGQEIRHALHPGPVREYLKRLAASEEFAAATDRSIKPRRMADRECVLRFLAFHVAPWEEYAGGSLDGHLAEVMKKINAMTSGQRDALAGDFKKAMVAARRIFGRQAFRKLGGERLNPISKPLFEAWGVQLARCSSDQADRLVERREEVLSRFVTLLNEDPEFDKAISLSTSMPQRIRKRFAAIRDLVQEFF